MQRPSIAQLQAYAINDIPAVKIGPGCVRRDIAGTYGARSWIVEIDPGCEWPYDDQHAETGEVVYVISGELIEGTLRYDAGTCLVYRPRSSHRPRSEGGVRLFGFNVISRDEENHVD